MEIALMIIMLMVAVIFMLKLTFHRIVGMAAICLLTAAFVVVSCDLAINQSKTEIGDWLQRTDLMLDAAIWLTVDVAFQIWFCVMAEEKASGPLTRRQNICYQLTLWFPGVLIFPMLFALLVEVIFNMPGVDFGLLGWCCGLCVFISFPLCAIGLKWLLSERELRLELIYMLSLLVAALGIVVTVNGRTASVGSNAANWLTLAEVMLIFIAAAVGGFLFYRIYELKKI